MVKDLDISDIALLQLARGEKLTFGDPDEPRLNAAISRLHDRALCEIVGGVRVLTAAGKARAKALRGQEDSLREQFSGESQVSGKLVRGMIQCVPSKLVTT